MPRREPGMPIPVSSARRLTSAEIRKLIGPQASPLLRPNLGLPEVPTDPGLLRNPRYAELPPYAFEKGQDPEKYIKSGEEIEQRRQQAQQRQSQTNYGRALQDQSREPEGYDWQELPDGTHRKVPAAPYYIGKEEPSTVLSQNAQSARWKSVEKTPEQIEAQRTGKAPPLFGSSPKKQSETQPTSSSTRETGNTPLNPKQQMDVLTKWQMDAKTPQERKIRDDVAWQIRKDDFGRNPSGTPEWYRKAKERQQADFEAWDRGDSGSVGMFGSPRSTTVSNSELYSKEEIGFDPNLADKVSSKVGFDVLSSRDRTADVLRQSKTAEVVYDNAKKAADRLKQPLFREQFIHNTIFESNTLKKLTSNIVKSKIAKK